ncbi:MAG: Gfo/Idh/MocA family protein, partial [Chitinophagales bacterium]
MNNQLQTLQWGIIGLGKIAHSFCQDLQLVDNTAIAAVASRSTAKAEKFAAEYGAAKSYGSYQELFEDPNVDIVYIATPHDSHAEWSIAAMNAKKHVLCEKPLGVNQSQVKAMVEVAQQNSVFFMEALWSKFNPTIKTCIELAKSGTAIGEVNYVNADFTFSRNDADDSRMLNMELAGGSLLDMGIYPVFLAYSIFG